VLDPATEDFKSSAQKYLERADAVILHRSGTREPRWPGISLASANDRPVFVIDPPEYVSSEVVEFVEQRLKAHSSFAPSV
jgi:hypothetical protein